MNRYLGANIGQIYLVVLVDIMFKYRIQNWMFIMITMWRFPKIMVSPNCPFIDGFSILNHPAIGDSRLWKPPYESNQNIVFKPYFGDTPKIEKPPSWINVGLQIASGKPTVCYGTWPFIVDIPIKNGDSSFVYVYQRVSKKSNRAMITIP